MLEAVIVVIAVVIVLLIKATFFSGDQSARVPAMVRQDELLKNLKSLRRERKRILFRMKRPTKDDEWRKWRSFIEAVQNKFVKSFITEIKELYQDAPVELARIDAGSHEITSCHVLVIVDVKIKGDEYHITLEYYSTDGSGKVTRLWGMEPDGIVSKSIPKMGPVRNYVGFCKAVGRRISKG